jgi:hypothetical protein
MVFYKNRDEIYRKYKIYYPETYGYEQHIMYSLAIHGQFPYWVRNIIGFEEIVANLGKEIDFYQPAKVLISSEDFITHFGSEEGCNIDKLHKLIEVVNPKQITVILYLRRQDLMIESLYKHEAKNFEIINIKGPLYVNYTSLDYYNLIVRLEKIFNNINYPVKILPRIYMKDFEKKWDIIEDFCRLLSINPINFNKLSEKEMNISLSLPSAKALIKFKEKYLIEFEYFEKLIYFLHELDKKLSYSKVRGLSQEKRKRILDYYKKSNEKLFKEYFKTDNLFVFTEIEHLEDNFDENSLENETKEVYKSLLEFVQENLPSEILTYRNRVYISQIYGDSPLTMELIRAGIINDWVGGRIEVCNEEGIAGWLVDLQDESPYFLVKLNGLCVCIRRPDIKRTDISKIYGISCNTGF